MCGPLQWGWEFEGREGPAALAPIMPTPPHSTPKPKTWTHSFFCPSATCQVTNIDRLTLNALLDRLGLRHLFAATVCAEDGMDTLSQSFLSAAIKLGRPPNQCVVFGACPAAVTAAHNCTMKVRAVLGRCGALGGWKRHLGVRMQGGAGLRCGVGQVGAQLHNEGTVWSLGAAGKIMAAGGGRGEIE